LSAESLEKTIRAPVFVPPRIFTASITGVMLKDSSFGLFRQLKKLRMPSKVLKSADLPINRRNFLISG